MESLYGDKLSKTLYDLCSNVKRRIFIASPYIGGEATVNRLLTSRWILLKEKIEFRLVIDNFSPNNCDPRTLKFLLENGAKIRSLKALHAKIYIIDDECIITSANLTNTAFTKRHEIGLKLNNKETKRIINIFEILWNIGSQVNKISKQRLNSFKNKRRNSDDDRSGNGFENLWPLPGSEVSNYGGWLKVSGWKDKESRLKIFRPNREVLTSFHGCSKRGRPRLKKNEIVILSRMGRKNKINDHYIFGRAIVDIPYREGVDDLKRYKNRINLDKKIAFETINRWPWGFWVKNVEIIKGNQYNYLWLKELKYKDDKQVVENKSLGQQSHVKLDYDQINLINKNLDKSFNKYGKIIRKNPSGLWLNRHIKNKKNWIKKK